MSGGNNFEHIPLRFVKNAPPKKPKGGGRKKNQKTESNKINRALHADNLRNATSSIKYNWEESLSKRKQKNLPEIPSAIPLFLKIDPDNLPLEDLRKFGIEVIGELEDGFIIGSSADITLGELTTKILKFAEQKENKAAGLWEIIQGENWRSKNILSPQLYEEWSNIKDNELFILDVGVACLGTLDVPSHPISRKKNLKDYDKAVVRWEKNKSDAQLEWIKLSKMRALQLKKFVEGYNGQILEMFQVRIDNKLHLPDSFTCRIRISGKGLRDLVLNFPFVFDIQEKQTIDIKLGENLENEPPPPAISLSPPDKDAPKVCVIDSGIQERHILLKNAIDMKSSRSWVGSTSDVADYVRGGGHGTRVAGAILYPQGFSNLENMEPVCWIQNARVLDSNNSMPDNLFPPKLLEEIVEHFYNSTNTRIYNQSLNTLYPCRLVHMSSWAATMDILTWKNDILFIQSAGNLGIDRPSQSNLRLGIRDHLIQGRNYPSYLLEKSARISDPAQSLQAVTVGSVGISSLVGLYSSFSKNTEPSSFSCTGPGIWGVIKPEIVEFGGDFAFDTGTPPNFSNISELSPELVRSTMYGGPHISKDLVGTSFSTPKASHIVAAIEKAFPDESTLLYRALLIQSARWPEWAEMAHNKGEIIRSIGYGIPNLEKSLHNSHNRITLISQGKKKIKAKEVHIYEVIIPSELRNPAEDNEIRIDITLSYKAEPRRTRRNKRRYLSTWLDWTTSKKNETSDAFLKRVIDHSADELSTEDNEDSGLFKWMIREQDRYGKIDGVNRSSGTIQKDWAYIKSYELENSFYIAVVGHTGWNIDPEATVPYSIVITFESLNPDLPIYTQIALENRIEVEEEIIINSNLKGNS